MPTQDENKNLTIVAEPDKIIPKLATNVNLTKVENGSIVVRFFAQHPTGGPAALIETIIFDEKHARRILKALTEVINGEPVKKDL